MTVLLRPVNLHIPDGFLSVPVSLVFWVITIVILGTAIKNTQGQISEHRIPLMGVMGAFIFAAQMINFPVAGGTSGHLLGGVLISIILGPWVGMVVMATVIGVQAVIFQDGGLIALGANIFNMGTMTIVIGYGFYSLVKDKNRRVLLFGVGLASWLSVIAGALFTALQLWLSETSSIRVVFPAMIGVHMFIGIGEALITVAAITFIFKTRPDLLSTNEVSGAGYRWIIPGLLISGLVIILSPLASIYPDGLESVAARLGFIDSKIAVEPNLLANYSFSLIDQPAVSKIFAGSIGIIAVILVIFISMRSIKKIIDSSTVSSNKDDGWLDRDS